MNLNKSPNRVQEMMKSPEFKINTYNKTSKYSSPMNQEVMNENRNAIFNYES